MLQSLPSQSRFQIFGISNEKEAKLQENNDKNLNEYKRLLQSDEEFGVDEILPSLKNIFESSKNLQKRVFVFIADNVLFESNVLNCIEENCSSENQMVRLFSVGIGNKCSRENVLQSSRLGKGSFIFIGDQHLSSLRSTGISILEKASEPALDSCTLRFLQNEENMFDENSLMSPAEPIELGQVHRN